MIHLSCGRGEPLGARWFKTRFKGHMECHCLLFQAEGRLILVDTGLSREELNAPQTMGWFAKSLGLQAQPELAAYHQIQELDLDPATVTDIVLTHLDLDHAGGLIDFPNARIHVSERELSAAKRSRTISERLRYRRQQWQHCNWVPHRTTDPSDIDALPVVLRIGNWALSLLPLFGHTRGHCGVLIQSEQRTLLHCGDAYYDRSELSEAGSFFYRCFKRGVDVSIREATKARQRLETLSRERPEIHFFCSHDPEEFASCIGRGAS